MKDAPVSPQTITLRQVTEDYLKPSDSATSVLLAEISKLRKLLQRRNAEVGRQRKRAEMWKRRCLERTRFQRW